MASIGRLLMTVHRRVAVLRTVHALPFAAVGVVLASPPWPEPSRWLLLAACVVFGRATVVAFGRIFDAPPDVATAAATMSSVPAPDTTPKPVWGAFAAHGAIATVFLAWLLGPLTGWLSMPFLLLLGVYAALRRHSGLSHALLGAALAASPIAARVAVRGDIRGIWPATVLIALGIGAWATCFDMVYSLRPELRDGHGRGRFARAPALSTGAVLRLATLGQAAGVVLFVAAGATAGMALVYYLALGLLAALLARGWQRLHRDGAESIATTFVRTNLLTGPVLLLGVAAGRLT